jgi:hypothetical protein
MKTLELLKKNVETYKLLWKSQMLLILEKAGMKVKIVEL